MGDYICERCMSPVTIQAFQQEHTSVVILLYECKQCRKTKTMGFTTERGVAIHKEEMRLREALMSAETPQRIAELEQRLSDIATLKSRYSLGL